MSDTSRVPRVSEPFAFDQQSWVSARCHKCQQLEQSTRAQRCIYTNMARACRRAEGVRRIRNVK
eukprot:7840261-Pyramimonas_sp.AAC.1